MIKEVKMSLFNLYYFKGYETINNHTGKKSMSITGKVMAYNKEQAVKALNSKDITVYDLMMRKSYKGELEKAEIKEDRISRNNLE